MYQSRFADINPIVRYESPTIVVQTPDQLENIMWPQKMALGDKLKSKDLSCHLLNTCKGKAILFVADSIQN